MLKYKENPDIDSPLVISLLETRGGNPRIWVDREDQDIIESKSEVEGYQPISLDFPPLVSRWELTKGGRSISGFSLYFNTGFSSNLRREITRGIEGGARIWVDWCKRDEILRL